MELLEFIAYTFLAMTIFVQSLMIKNLSEQIKMLRKLITMILTRKEN